MYLYYYKITNIHNLGCKQRLRALILIISLILIIFEIQPITVHVCIHICKSTHLHIYTSTHLHSYNRPTESIIHVPLQVNRFQKSILLIVQYKYSKSCSGDFILQNLILRSRSCGTGFITQSSWVFHFHLTIMVRWNCFVPQLYQLRRGIRRGQPLNIFT